jgi:Protein of unknown function, DUF547
VLRPHPLNATQSGAALPGEPTAAAALEAARGGQFAATDALSRVDPSSLVTDAEKLAFGIDVYNALFLQARARWQPRGAVTGNLGLFFRAAYRVGPWLLSLNDLEHGVLRRNRLQWPFPWRALARKDPRWALAPSALEPRIHFALHCGATSCPPIRAYRAVNLEAQLTLATEAYVRAHTVVDRARRRVWVPALCRLYARDFGPDRAALLRFVAAALPAGEDRDFVMANAPTLRARSSPYDWQLTPAP